MDDAPTFELTPGRVEREHGWIRDRGDVVVPLINRLRRDLGDAFGTEVDPVGRDQYRRQVDDVFADGDLGVNVAALSWLLRELDVRGDYPGFVVDEFLGRRLAGAIAGTQPLGLLGEATFHYADATHHPGDGGAGLDDLDAALAAGFQTRLPGWDWTERPSPFAVEPEG